METVPQTGRRRIGAHRSLETSFVALAVGWRFTSRGGSVHDRHEVWNDLAAQIAVDSIRCTTAAGSGHPTSSMSCAHLLAVLFAEHLRTDLTEPKSPANDRFILSKGHAAPALYSVLKAIGAI